MSKLRHTKVAFGGIYPNEINQTYYDLEMELLDLFSFNDGHSEPMKQLEVLRKELNRFKNERDLYDEASELDMMFPNGQDY